MILIISLAVAALFVLLCGKALRAHPAPFYALAAAVSAAVTGLYWLAPEFLSLQLRAKLPLVLGALGTACFIFVMYAGALPNGHALMKKIMPIRGELSIFACLLTLGHNLSYGKNYLTPGYLFSGPFSAAKAAAWVSVILIVLMLVLTITSVKAVRRRFQPKSWKALQRWAYLFYALIYIHVLLLAVPNLLRGRSSYLVNLLVYSAVFLSYAVCRIQKAVLMKKKQAARVTGRRQLSGALVGILLTLLLTACVTLPGALEKEQAADSPLPAVSDAAEPSAEPDAQPSEPAQPEPSAEPENITPGPEESSEPADEPDAEAAELPEVSPQVSETPPPAPSQEQPPAEPSSVPSAEPSPAPSVEPELSPAPASKYRDGTYTGTGEGYEGPVTVSVTIAGDKITAIEVVSYVDDDEYMNDAKTGVITSVLLFQSTNVSAVSGATYSSEGIMDAVAAALQQAAN